ncbi:MAG: DUF1365 domain-containing protein [Geminicoccaceae bacterium]
MMRSRLYRGFVGHTRHKPFRHSFRYRVFWVLLDLDELGELAARFRLLKIDRFGVYSFWRKDHGRRDGSDLRPWIDGKLAEAGLPPAFRVEILCMPRCLGWGFDPISVYFCYGEDERPNAIVHEVKNTFGGQRVYVLPVEEPDHVDRVRQQCDKDFFVSPFIAMRAHYRFDIEPPGEHVGVGIRETTERGLELTAWLRGERMTLDDRTLLSLIPRFLIQSFLVIGRIHWHALKLWLKGAVFHSPSAHGAAGEGPSRARPDDPPNARSAG